MRFNTRIAAALAAASIAMSAASATARAVTPVDLSGRWVLNLAKSKLAKSTHLRGQTVVIRYLGNDIAFNFIDDPPKKSAMTFTPDGKEHVLLDRPINTEPTGLQACFRDLPHQRVYSKARWEKSGITVEMHYSEPGGCYPPRNDTCPCENDSMHSNSWKLSPDGHTLTRRSQDPPDVRGNYETQIFVYSKQ
jgi:hypothetical protein